MLSDEIKKKVERATVNFTRKGGRGILTTGELILTAAHVVDPEAEDFATVCLGSHVFEEIETSTGEKLIVGPFAISLIDDIAAFGALDNQEFFEQGEEYERFCESVEPLEIFNPDPEQFNEHGELVADCYVYTHEKIWVDGRATWHNNFPAQKSRIVLEANSPINAGTSGSAILNSRGQIIAIMANVTSQPPYVGSEPRPHGALPVWVLDRILESARGEYGSL